MRYLFIICIFCSWHILIAQSSHHSLHLDGAYRASVFCLSADSLPTGVIHAFDSLVLLKFDWDGALLAQKTAYRYPNEDVEIHHFEALPDSGFILSYEAANCDTDNGTTCLMKYDKDFNLVWLRCFSNNQPQVLLPQKFTVVPNGDIIGVWYGYIVGINSNDGTDLWQLSQPVPSYAFEPAGMFSYAQFNEALEGMTEDGAYFSIELDPSAGIYSLFQEDFGLDIRPSQVVYAPNGAMIAVEESSKTAYRYTGNGFSKEPFPVSAASFDSIKPVFFGKGTWHQVQKVDSFMHWQSDFFRPEGLLSQSRKHFLYGKELYSKGLPFSNNFWYSIVKNDDFTVVERPWDASVIDIRQRTPMSMLPNQTWGGGDFQIKLHNAGEKPIDSILVIAEYGRVGSFCPKPIQVRKTFANLNLLAGQSRDLDIGDLYAPLNTGTTGWNEEACFWAMALNGDVDKNHQNDIFCWSINTATKNPRSKPISVSPNPTQGFVFIESLSEDAQKVRVFDVFGKKVMEEELTQTNNSLTLDELSSGIYFLKIGTTVRKIIKE